MCIIVCSVLSVFYFVISFIEMEALYSILVEPVKLRRQTHRTSNTVFVILHFVSGVLILFRDDSSFHVLS